MVSVHLSVCLFVRGELKDEMRHYKWGGVRLEWSEAGSGVNYLHSTISLSLPYPNPTSQPSIPLHLTPRVILSPPCPAQLPALTLTLMYFFTAFFRTYHFCYFMTCKFSASVLSVMLVCVCVCACVSLRVSTCVCGPGRRSGAPARRRTCKHTQSNTHTHAHTRVLRLS